MNYKKFLSYRLFFTCVSVIMLLVMAIPVLAKDNTPNADGKFFCTTMNCTITSIAALKACFSKAGDAVWIARGNCLNLSDPEAREECEIEAKASQIEGWKSCVDQFEARLQVCASLGEAPYDPQITSADFVNPSEIGHTITPNPYFPLTPGVTRIYKTDDDETITVSVTNDTKQILGVTCAVVRDVVEKEGEVVEDTEDWYAQDISGNVWYFGEISQEFEDGELVSLEGSWKAGVDSAKPGVLMNAIPQVGVVYRQEFSLGNAEDLAEILSLTGSATVPAASCNGDCLVTKDFTPMQPDLVENKYYASGKGVILEINPETGERVELIEIKTTQ